MSHSCFPPGPIARDQRRARPRVLLNPVSPPLSEDMLGFVRIKIRDEAAFEQTGGDIDFSASVKFAIIKFGLQIGDGKHWSVPVSATGDFRRFKLRGFYVGKLAVPLEVVRFEGGPPRPGFIST